MLGLNKTQLKNGIILALLFFLTSQVFKEYNSAVNDELIYTQKWVKIGTENCNLLCICSSLTTVLFFP